MTLVILGGLAFLLIGGLLIKGRNDLPRDIDDQDARSER